MERGNRRKQYYIVSAVCSSAVTVGVSLSWATPALPNIARNQLGFPISKDAISWMVAISSIGFIVGSYVARLVSDKFGRRATILSSSLPMVVGTILMILAWEPWMLSSGRVCWGCGTGMLVAVSGVYIAEIADKDIRGLLSLSNRFMASFGSLLVITVGAFVSYQTLNYTLLVLPVMFFITCWWIPESPYFLLKVGKVEAARKTIQMLTGVRDEHVLDDKITQMQSHVKVEMRRSGSVKEFLTGKRYRKAIFVILGLKVPQIMTGLYAVQNYLGIILMESNSGMNITVAVISFGAIKFLLGIMSSVLVDRVGRRPLLVGSFFATGVIHAFIAVHFGFQDKYGTSYPYNLIPFTLIIMAIVISFLGYESVAYLIPAELFPLNVKSTAIAMTTMLGGLTNFISVKTYQPTRDWIGLSGVFGTYALAAFFGAGFCYFLVPETKGKSLKEIQIELNGNIYNDNEEEKLNKAAVNNYGEDIVKTVNENSGTKDTAVSPPS